uniref:Uncharacterized protein n=1 Tax=Setaria digitata TaxID=48799 RepID=A0A915PBC8_9BILA
MDSQFSVKCWEINFPGTKRMYGFARHVILKENPVLCMAKSTEKANMQNGITNLKRAESAISFHNDAIGQCEELRESTAD